MPQPHDQQQGRPIIPGRDAEIVLVWDMLKALIQSHADGGGEYRAGGWVNNTFRNKVKSGISYLNIRYNWMTAQQFAEIQKGFTPGELNNLHWLLSEFGHSVNAEGLLSLSQKTTP